MEANTTDENKAFTAAPETKLHFLDYWRIIRIRKTVILAVFLLVSLTTTVVTFLLPESYSSMVKISIEQDMPDVDQRFLVKPTADPFFIQTEFQRIQSKPVLYKVIEELNLQEQWGAKFKQPGPLSKEKTVEILKNLIRVDQSHNTSLVEIHAYSDNKEEAASIAQKVADVYAKVRMSVRADLKSNAIVALRQQLSLKEQAITNQLKVVNDLRQKLEILDYEAAGNQPTPTLPQETLRQINHALHEARARFLEASNQYAALTNLTREKLKDAASLQVPSSRLADLISQENAVEQKLADLRGAGLVLEEHPEVKSKTELLKTIRTQLDNALSGVLIGMKSHMDSAQAAAQFYTQFLDSSQKQDLANYAKTRPYYEAKEELLRL
jgi:uncharacterized protein involved in exopolysaccharide biosynthesis